METNVWHTNLPGNEFDYLALMGALRDYKRPRDKVTKLLRRGDVVRVKKGIYILGPQVRKETVVSREILGNLLYGPSYLSLEYALSWHQLIPEHVEAVTSVTMHKSKAFATPLGHFTYHHVKTGYYPYGQLAEVLPDGRGFLLASPEKAIADKVYFAHGLKTHFDLRQYLFSDLRIDPEGFSRLDTAFFHELAAVENKASLRILAELIREYA